MFKNFPYQKEKKNLVKSPEKKIYKICFLNFFHGKILTFLQRSFHYNPFKILKGF